MKDRTFAERLKKVIEANPDLTEAGLAVKAGLANSTIRKLLAGSVQNPRVDTAMKICAALGTTVDQFMKPDQSAAEAEISRLVSLLPEHLRRQILGYTQAVASARDPEQQELNEEPK